MTILYWFVETLPLDSRDVLPLVDGYVLRVAKWPRRQYNLFAYAQLTGSCVWHGTHDESVESAEAFEYFFFLCNVRPKWFFPRLTKLDYVFVQPTFQHLRVKDTYAWSRTAAKGMAVFNVNFDAVYRYYIVIV